MIWVWAVFNKVSKTCFAPATNVALWLSSCVKPLVIFSIPADKLCDPVSVAVTPVFKEPIPWSNSLYFEAYCFNPNCKAWPPEIIWLNELFKVSTLS